VDPNRDDAEGYEKFFRAVQPTLARVAFLYIADAEQAHDLARETLVRAWQHWPKVSRHPHPEAWCFTVMRNLAATRWRRSRLERSHRGDRARDATAPSADHLDVVAALRRLPVMQERAIVLHDVMGFTAEEVSVELGTSAGTVRVWLSRARQTLAAALADRLPERAEGGAV
jgi:RNA polymerase sigma-70 factor (ECF subfamily)